MPVSEQSTGVVRTSVRAREILLAAGLFVLGFLFAAALLHTLLPDPINLHADMRSEKLAMLASWQGRYTSAAFGSSHVHNGFDAKSFDRAFNKTRSANLAIAGGSQSEQRVMALRFVRQLTPPDVPSACLVLLELGAGVNFTADHLVHPRAIDIYDLPTARLVTHFVTPGMSLTQRFGRQGYAVAAAGLHYANIGMLSNLIFAPPLDPALLADQTRDDRRGQRVESFSAANQPSMRRELASLDLAHPTPEPEILSPGHAELIEQLTRASPVHGLAFAYVKMPLINDPAHLPTLPDHLTVDGQQVPIVDLARPDRYPQLYNLRLWHDDSHLTGEGAALASTLLAQQLTLWYAQHGSPAPCTR